MSTLNLEKLSELIVDQNGNIFDQNQRTNLVKANLALQPDFNIFQFYPDATHNGYEMPFRQGNIVAFLNGFYPPNYNTAHQPQFYLSPVNENDAITNLGIEKGRIVLAIPRMKWKFPYDRLFLYHRSPGSAFLTIDNSATWNFIFDKAYSTPYLILMGRDMDIDISGFESENSFRYGFTSAYPNSSATATIDVYHGRVYKNIDFIFSLKDISLAHTTRVVVKQVDYNGTEWIDYLSGDISTTPLQVIVSLPQRNSHLTRVQILGGGAGETGTFRFVVHLKE